MSALAIYFYGRDNGKNRNEVVNDEDDDVGSIVHVLPSPHFSSVVFDACLLFEGAH